MNDEKQEQQDATETSQQDAAALTALDAMGADEQGAAQNDDALAESIASESDRKAQEQAEQAAREQGAQMGAAMAVGFAENMLKMRLPYVEIDKSSREGLVDSLAPVLAKHGGGMPAWLQPYAEELRFGMTVAGVGFGVWMQVQAHKEAANDDGSQQGKGKPAAGSQNQESRQPEPKEQADPETLGTEGDAGGDVLEVARMMEAG